MAARNVDDLAGLRSVITSAVTKPSTPYNVTANNPTGNGLDLAWSYPFGGAYVYRVFRSTDNAAWSRILTVATSPQADSGLAPGTTYFYKVAGVNGNLDEGAWSTAAEDQTLPSQVVGPPGFTTVTNNAMRVFWTAATGAFTYNLKWSTDNFVTSNNDQTGITNNYYDHGALLPGTSYFYKVVAVNQAAMPPPIRAVGTKQTKPNPPSISGFSNITSSGLRLDWSTPSGAKTYDVLRATDNVWTTVVTAAADLAVTNHPDVGLLPNTTYGYIVEAWNEAHDELATSAASAKVTRPTVATSMTLGTPAAHQITVSWSAPSPAERPLTDSSGRLTATSIMSPSAPLPPHPSWTPG